MKNSPIKLSIVSAVIALTALNSVSPFAYAADAKKISPSELSIEQVFRAKTYAGQAAKVMKFSFDGRYLAYLWNPYGVPGSDLYIYDTSTGQSQRVTSLDAMKKFDAPEDIEKFEKKWKQKELEEQIRQEKAVAQAAYLRGENVSLVKWEEADLAAIKKELEDKKAREEASKLAKSESANKDEKKEDKKDEKKESKPKEVWELRDELKKKREKEKLKVGDVYPGVENFEWANTSNELIFQYRGDLFRLTLLDNKLERLTSTDKVERIIGYHLDDKAYLYSDERRIYSARFDSSQLRQINRELVHPLDAEKKYAISATYLSENQASVAIVAEVPERTEGAAPASSGRQVEIMSYSERFATAKKVPREVSDDKRKVPARAIYINRVSDSPSKLPTPVFTHDGGDVWFEMSPIDWTRDGSRYTFATWEREKDLLRIYVGEIDSTDKAKIVFERKGNVGHEVVSALKPQFTPDGKKLITVLDEQGFRQPYSINIESKSATPILKGNFESTNILSFSEDSQTMFVLANKDNFAAQNIFQVNLSNGDMTAIGNANEFHRATAVAKQSNQFASIAGNWSNRPELKLYQTGQTAAKTLTQSHDPEWQKIDVLRPERFSFKNRHGDEIHAYVFKPTNWSSSDKRPAIVYTYGGPLGERHTVEVDSFQPTAYLFGMYMAAKHGYVTVAVDPRGQSNYGRRFSGANWEQPGKPQTEDLEDLAKHMHRNFGVDQKRIGLTGWSFGGFQTQYTMYTSPDTFAAGVAGAGPTEWENYNSWYSGRTIGKVDRSKPVLRKYSLLPLTHGLRKPLLLVHGMQDPNVLYQDTVNVYRALLENGKAPIVDLFLDPDGDHAMGGVVKANAWHKKYEAFFLQHLGKAK